MNANTTSADALISLIDKQQKMKKPGSVASKSAANLAASGIAR